jgi:proliferating cell nuclear antigen
MSHIAEYVEIKCSTQSVTFTCKGDCAERSTVYHANENGIHIAYSEDEDGDEKQNKAKIVQGIYELKNLVLFTKCTALHPEIQIFIKNNYPLVIKYTIATLGRILLCLTPIDDSDEIKTYSDDEDLYQDDKIKLKDEYDAEDD